MAINCLFLGPNPSEYLEWGHLTCGRWENLIMSFKKQSLFIFGGLAKHCSLTWSTLIRGICAQTHYAWVLAPHKHTRAYMQSNPWSGTMNFIAFIILGLIHPFSTRFQLFVGLSHLHQARNVSPHRPNEKEILVDLIKTRLIDGFLCFRFKESCRAFHHGIWQRTVTNSCFLEYELNILMKLETNKLTILWSDRKLGHQMLSLRGWRSTLWSSVWL